MSNRIKVSEAGGFVRFPKLVNNILEKAKTIPDELAYLKTPNPGLKYWIRRGKDVYSCFYFLNGEWYTQKRDDQGFYTFYQPLLRWEEYLEFHKIWNSNPKFYGKLRTKRIDLDYDYYLVNSLRLRDRRAALRTKARFIKFCKDRKIKIDNLPDV